MKNGGVILQVACAFFAGSIAPAVECSYARESSLPSSHISSLALLAPTVGTELPRAVGMDSPTVAPHGSLNPERYTVPEEVSERIRAEEVLRAAVRQDLESIKPSPSLGERLWSLLNSAFALWFLSSVILAGFTAALTIYQNRRRSRIQKAELQTRLNTEISGRIEQAMVGMRLYQRRIEHGEPILVPTIYSHVISYLDNIWVFDRKNPRDFSIYMEFQRRTFRSLLFELSTVVDRAKLPILRRTLADYERTAQSASIIDVKKEAEPLDRNESIDAVQTMIALLQGLQAHPNWRFRMESTPGSAAS